MQGFDKIPPAVSGEMRQTQGENQTAAGGHIYRRTGTIFGRTQLDS